MLKILSEELERLLCEYHQSCLEEGQEIVFSMDGKTLRGTIPCGEMRGSQNPAAGELERSDCDRGCPKTHRPESC